MNKQEILHNAKEHLPSLLIADLALIVLSVICEIIFRQSLDEGISTFLKQQIPFWLLLIIFSVGYLLFRSVYSIQLVSKSSLKKAPKINGLYFNSDFSDYFTYDFIKEKVWDNISHKTIGNRVKAEINFDTGIVHVTRNNTEGRVLLKITKYKDGESIKPYVQKKPDKEMRNIIVEFEARITNESISIKVVFIKYNTTDWITSDSKEITTKEWHPYTIAKKIPSNENFIIRLEDFNCKNLPCQYFIRKIVIKEVT